MHARKGEHYMMQRHHEWHMQVYACKILCIFWCSSCNWENTDRWHETRGVLLSFQTHTPSVPRSFVNEHGKKKIAKHAQKKHCPKVVNVLHPEIVPITLLKRNS